MWRSGDRQREVYFPKGRWRSYWDASQVIRGPKTVTVDVPLLVSPARGPHRYRRHRTASPRDVARRAVTYARPRMSPLVGHPVPAVTSTCSTSGTWLHDVPRICRTASAMPFMPWM